MEIENEDPYKLEELCSYSAYIALRARLVDSEVLQDRPEEKQKKLVDNMPSVPKKSQPSKGNRHSNELKAEVVHLVDVHPKNSARTVALELNLNPNTVQRWYRTWKKDPDSLFKTIGRPRIIEPEGELAAATKNVVSDLYFKNPTATIDQLMDNITSNFEDLVISKKNIVSIHG